MPSYTHPFTLFRILLLPAAIAYLYLNFYTAINLPTRAESPDEMLRLSL
jgi:hypothetical protein